MARPERCAVGWLAAMAMLVGCSGSSGGPSDAGVDGDGDPLPDGKPPQGLFPLRVASDGGSLVTDDGAPFLLHGEAAWSLIAQLSLTQTETYLANRQGRGVDAILVNLIEHKFAAKAPANQAGVQPFTTRGDLSKPNEAYFAHADKVIDLAAIHGIAVLLTPAYLGFDLKDEGWAPDMVNMSAAQCRGYGEFVGKRYADRTNIIWVWGGDATPPSGSAAETCMKAISDGVLNTAPQLATGHWAPESTSRDEAAFASLIDLVGVYSYLDVPGKCRAARAGSPRQPTFLLETTYEGEKDPTKNDAIALARDLRRAQWWGLLGCGAGEFSGNAAIWKFDTNWNSDRGTNSDSSRDQAQLRILAETMRWNTFSLDDGLVVTGRGSGSAEIVAAVAADRKQAALYLPHAAARTIEVDLGHLTSAVTATWFDPTGDNRSAAGDGMTGTQTFTTPGNNLRGDADWVLILNVP